MRLLISARPFKQINWRGLRVWGRFHQIGANWVILVAGKAYRLTASYRKIMRLLPMCRDHGTYLPKRGSCPLLAQGPEWKIFKQLQLPSRNPAEMTQIWGSSVPQYLCDLRTMHDGQFLWIRATHGHTLKTVDVKSGLYVEPSAFMAVWAWIFSLGGGWTWGSPAYSRWWMWWFHTFFFIFASTWGSDGRLKV